MFELGDAAYEEHQRIIHLSQQKKSIKQFIFVGELFYKHYFESSEALFFTSTEKAKKWFQSQDLKGSTLLLKGSRGMRLETLLS